MHAQAFSCLGKSQTKQKGVCCIDAWTNRLVGVHLMVGYDSNKRHSPKRGEFPFWVRGVSKYKVNFESGLKLEFVSNLTIQNGEKVQKSLKI